MDAYDKSGRIAAAVIGVAGVGVAGNYINDSHNKLDKMSDEVKLATQDQCTSPSSPVQTATAELSGGSNVSTITLPCMDTSGDRQIKDISERAQGFCAKVVKGEKATLTLPNGTVIACDAAPAQRG